LVYGLTELDLLQKLPRASHLQVQKTPYATGLFYNILCGHFCQQFGGSQSIKQFIVCQHRDKIDEKPALKYESILHIRFISRQKIFIIIKHHFCLVALLVKNIYFFKKISHKINAFLILHVLY
jgi:hypothetical protein